MNYPEGPTYEAQVDSSQYDAILIGENDLGSVYIHGPFGDESSDVKIAYVIGMHPLESKSHRALFDELISRKDLKHCYFLYNKLFIYFPLQCLPLEHFAIKCHISM